MKKIFDEYKKPLYFSLFLGVTVLIVTLVAYLGFSITNPIIEANNEQRIKDNIALLFDPEAGYYSNDKLDAVVKYRTKDPAYTYVTDIYEVLYEEEVYAVIYNVWEQGKNDKINALIAIDPYTDTVLGVVYYKHGETPNLGALYAEAESTDKIVGQVITDDIVVDQISGATVTWGALETMYEKVKQHYINEEVHIDG